MSPENETELIRKVNEIHTYVFIGDPIHNKDSMISEHNNMKKQVDVLTSWMDNVKIRIAMIAGGALTIFEVGKAGVTWLINKH